MINHPLSGPALKLLTIVAAVFAVLHQHHAPSLGKQGPRHLPASQTAMKDTSKCCAANDCKKSPDTAISTRIAVRKLAGPYARMVMTAARKAHVSPKLAAAVVRVENGGNFHGSATRVSRAGAIGVMQLEPNTAWNLLRVNPWNARQNIDGGTRYLAMMLRQFNGDVRLALMAYNAGPTIIARGGRPMMAVAYARQVMRDAERV